MQKADRIAVLSEGSIVEQGTYSELMSDHTGVFYSLVQRQTAMARDGPEQQQQTATTRDHPEQ